MVSIYVTKYVFFSRKTQKWTRPSSGLRGRSAIFQDVYAFSAICHYIDAMFCYVYAIFPYIDMMFRNVLSFFAMLALFAAICSRFSAMRPGFSCICSLHFVISWCYPSLCTNLGSRRCPPKYGPVGYVYKS